VKIILAMAAVLTLSIALNWIYQVVRKPSELLFPVSGAFSKRPAETWAEYAPLFRKFATHVMTPDLLAAMAQVEGAGNPVARTYWRWSWTLHPFEIYRPASSAVGMYQITDGTYADASRYCIHDHESLKDRAGDVPSCGSNALYYRVVPAHAVELTAAYLDRNVAVILERHRMKSVALRRKQALAAVIHLCGAGAGDEYARRGFRLSEGQRCGDHEVRAYLGRIDAMRSVFNRLDAL
jgi:hypothetical protein